MVQNTEMDEELVQNGVMDEKFVKNFVMDAKIDPKVVVGLVGLSVFKIDGRNSLQPSDRKLLEEFIDENELCLLIGIPNRDSFLTIQYSERHSASSDLHVKELMPLREGLHVTTQCYLRQHDACRHSASLRESTRRKFMKGPMCRGNVQKMRSESSGYMWKTTGAFLKS